MNLHGFYKIIGTGRVKSAAAIRAEGFEYGIEEFLVKADAAVNHSAE